MTTGIYVGNYGYSNWGSNIDTLEDKLEYIYAYLYDSNELCDVAMEEIQNIQSFLKSVCSTGKVSTEDINIIGLFAKQILDSVLELRNRESRMNQLIQFDVYKAEESAFNGYKSIKATNNVIEASKSFRNTL